MYSLLSLVEMVSFYPGWFQWYSIFNIQFGVFSAWCLQCFDAVGWQDGNPASKNWVVRYWHGYGLGRGANDLHMV